jgi:hypothetical protein
MALKKRCKGFIDGPGNGILRETPPQNVQYGESVSHIP